MPELHTPPAPGRAPSTPPLAPEPPRREGLPLWFTGLGPLVLLAALVLAFLRFAVGLAGMVDPARVVAFVAAVDHAAGAEREEEGVEGIVRIGRVAAVCFLGADALAAVLDDARARGNLAGGEDAIAVQLGAADGVPGLDRGVFGGH